MKCQNCGKNECNFHYTYSVNGRSGETHLCSECADKLGYSNNMYFNTDSMFEDMISGFFGRRSFSPFGGRSLMSALLPRMTMLPLGLGTTCTCGGSCKTEVEESKNAEVEVDPEIKKRREINMLREQMRSAAEAEDFEKAAEIRDQIKKLENPEPEAPGEETPEQ